jgi:hypothetical protein
MNTTLNISQGQYIVCINNKLRVSCDISITHRNVSGIMLLLMLYTYTVVYPDDGFTKKSKPVASYSKQNEYSPKNCVVRMKNCF